MRNTFSRRTLLGGIAGTAAAGMLGACGTSEGAGGASAASGTIKFWDTVWGPAEYVSTGQGLVDAYKSTSGGFGAKYQSVDWGNWFQTFSSALAAGTGPAVSSGASTQSYQFYDQGQIAAADNLYSKLEKDGTLADFQPGVFDILKYKGALVAMPWSYDMGVFWYRPSLLEKAGVEVPTNWDELRQAGLKLKAIGVSGYGIAPTPAASNYKQFSVLCLNNGAPVIDDDGNVNCLSDKFIEATEFSLSLVKDGIIRPDMVGYTSANLYSEINKGNVGITELNAGSYTYLSPAAQKDFDIMPPITSPSGGNATAGSVQSLMMYTNTPSQGESEAFLEWYLTNMKSYWEKKVTLLVPLRKSITESIKETSPLIYKAGSLYGPNIQREFGKTFTSASARYDASPAMTEWGQKIAQGDGTARGLCEKLQAALEKIKQDS